MSDLQISLLAIGALVVACVYLFNLWQERQLRRRTEQAFAREHPDVLLAAHASHENHQSDGEPRVEPSINVDAPPVAPVHRPQSAPIAIDPVIDYVVEVTLPAPADAAALSGELRTQLADTGKSILVEGYDESSGDWRDAANGASCARLRFALQISNRSGCVTLNQLATFRDAVAAWAHTRNGEAKSLEIEAVQAMAVQLDRFCADVDIAIGINVVTADGTPFSGTRIRALAEQIGLRLEPDGVFYARSDTGEPVFTLDNHEPMPFMPEQMRALHTRGVTFLLDVPRVKSALHVFAAMLAAARSFAEELDGTLVDDNRAELTDGAIAAIRKQLEAILAKMDAGQIGAGGTRALRLFA